MSNLYLVTGGAGFIGFHIVKALVERGENVRVVDNLSTGNIERLACIRSAMDFVEADLADPQVCDRVVDGVDFVLHQAAIPSVQRSIRDPIASNRANVTATLNLLESGRNRGVRRFVYAASSSAYGDTLVLPKREDMPANPMSPYALQKFVGERYAKLYFDLYKFETVSLRYFNVFGPSQDPYSEYSAVIPKFITKLLAGEKLTIFGDGEQSRDFTYVANVVDASLRACEAKDASGKVFNVGTGQRFTLNETLRLLGQISGKNAQAKYDSPRTGDIRDSLADISLAREVLGYQPGVAFEEGLRRTWEWYAGFQR